MALPMDVLVAGSTVIGTTLGSFYAINKFPFFKGSGKTKCSDMDCHVKVELTSSKVVTLEDGQKEIFRKLDEMPDNIIKRLKEYKGLI